ncbi:hypothetical protein FB451DRAFT_1190243 [Mycena latifolia]|nr:hypothetical protein FB451DRAFT_1190243 [Mycena latifolia]
MTESSKRLSGTAMCLDGGGTRRDRGRDGRGKVVEWGADAPEKTGDDAKGIVEGGAAISSRTRAGGRREAAGPRSGRGGVKGLGDAISSRAGAGGRRQAAEARDGMSEVKWQSGRMDVPENAGGVALRTAEGGEQAGACGWCGVEVEGREREAVQAGKRSKRVLLPNPPIPRGPFNSAGRFKPHRHVEALHSKGARPGNTDEIDKEGGLRHGDDKRGSGVRSGSGPCMSQERGERGGQEEAVTCASAGRRPGARLGPGRRPEWVRRGEHEERRPASYTRRARGCARMAARKGVDAEGNEGESWMSSGHVRGARIVSEGRGSLEMLRAMTGEGGARTSMKRAGARVGEDGSALDIFRAISEERESTTDAMSEESGSKKAGAGAGEKVPARTSAEERTAYEKGTRRADRQGCRSEAEREASSLESAVGGAGGTRGAHEEEGMPFLTHTAGRTGEGGIDVDGPGREEAKRIWQILHLGVNQNQNLGDAIQMNGALCKQRGRRLSSAVHRKSLIDMYELRAQAPSSPYGSAAAALHRLGSESRAWVDGRVATGNESIAMMLGLRCSARNLAQMWRVRDDKTVWYPRGSTVGIALGESLAVNVAARYRREKESEEEETGEGTATCGHSRVGEIRQIPTLFLTFSTNDHTIKGSGSLARREGRSTGFIGFVPPPPRNKPSESP